MQGRLLAARSAAAIVLGWCACGAAMAEATASAHVGTPTLSYLDLAPADGVTPLLAWTADPTRSWSHAETTTPLAYIYHDVEGTYAPTTVSLNGILGTTGASTGAQGADAAASLVGSTAAGVDQGLQSWAYPLGGRTFSVTPMTAVTFMLPVRLSAATTIGSQGANGEAAGAWAVMSVNLDLGNGAFEDLLVDRAVSTVYTYNIQTGQVVNPPQSAWTDGTMSLTLVNGSATAVRGSLSVQVSAWADSAIPMASVPEPPASALALAGVAALAGMARRRLARR